MLKYCIQILNGLSPALCVSLIYKFLALPKKHPDKKHEIAVLNKAIKQKVVYNGTHTVGYVWGPSGGPKALLIHGWEGRAGNFGAIVNLLESLNYQIFAFDGRAQGASERKGTSMFDYTRYIEARVRDVNPQLIISHSFGSVPTLSALIHLEALKISHFIAITTPSDFRNYLIRFQKQMGLSDKTISKLVQRIEAKDQIDISTQNMKYAAKHLKVIPKMALIHSANDKILPIAESREVAAFFPNASLYELSGLGHYSILWATETLNIIQKSIETC